MNVRRLVTFSADFPIDEVEGEDGEILVYPGQAASVEIAKVLERLGCEVGEAEHAHEHGWQFSFVSGGVELWGQITCADEWYLSLVCPKRFFGPSQVAWKALAELLPGLDAELQADARFTNLVWYNPEKNGDPGSPHP